MFKIETCPEVAYMKRVCRPLVAVDLAVLLARVFARYEVALVSVYLVRVDK